jgi:hypothetical protein
LSPRSYVLSCTHSKILLHLCSGAPSDFLTPPPTGLGVGFGGRGGCFYTRVGQLDASRSSVPSADEDPSLSCVLRGAHNNDFCLPCATWKTHGKLFVCHAFH